MMTEVESHPLSGRPALVLNADYRPLSYYPLSLWCWQDAVKAVFLNRVNVIAEYDTVVRSANFQMALPSVIALREFINQDRSPAFTRFNVFLRDGFTCSYCGSPDELTFDHVIPKSKGGQTCWTNIVTACSPCNLRKGGRLPKEAGMYPAKQPIQPSNHMLREIGRRFPPNHMHDTWVDYLYWDIELEP